MLANKYFRNCFFTVAAIYWLYLWLRAIYSPLVFDEAISFFTYIKSGEFLPGLAYWSANNHYLNSLLTYLSFSLGGMDEWVLRLPNLLLFPLFAWWLYKIASGLISTPLSWMVSIIIFGCHYLLEFFAYSRGYGMAFTFMLGSLFYLREFHLSRKIKFLKPFLLCLTLMLFSNISTLPLAGLLVATMALALIGRKYPRQQRLLYIPLSLLPLAFGLWASFKLRSHEQLYYGGENGFWQDSLHSLQMVFFNSQHWGFDLLFAAMAISLMVGIGKALQRYKRLSRNIYLLWPGFMFFAILLFYPLGHYLLGLRFPFDRALLYWVLLGVLAAGAAAELWWRLGLKYNWLLLVPFLVFPLSFPLQVSLRHSSTDNWSREQIPDRFYSFLANKQLDSTIGGSYLQAPQWNYLQVKEGARVNPFQTGAGYFIDYRLAEKAEVEKLQNNYQPIDSNDTENLFLLKRKQSTKKTMIWQKSLTELKDHVENIALYQEPYQLADSNLAFSFSGDFRSARQPFGQTVAVQGRNSQGETVYWNSFGLSQYLKNNKDWQNFNLFVVLDKLPEEVSELEIFLWNPDMNAFSLKNARYSAWRLSNSKKLKRNA